MRAIEDELGVVIGKEGHTIRKWKSGEIPQSSAFREEFLQAAEMIAKGMVKLGRPYVDGIWGERFLNAVGHPASTEIVATCLKPLLPYESSSPSTHNRNNMVEVEILIKFSLPRDLFFTRIRLWLERLVSLTNGATHFAIHESEKTG